GHEYNRGAGVDLELNLTDHWLVKGFLMGTATPGVRSSFLSGRVDSRYEDDGFRLIGVYEDVGSNFNSMTRRTRSYRALVLVPSVLGRRSAELRHHLGTASGDARPASSSNVA